MHSLAAAMLLATPVFGFSLQPPSITPIVDPAAYGVIADVGAVTPALLQDVDSAETVPSDAAEAEPQKSAKSKEQDEYHEQVKRRNSLIKIHRPLGLATWA